MTGLIVHGGAGGIREGVLPGCREGCRAAAETGWRVLDEGRSAVAAVEAAVTALEDDPRFNAGTGSVLNRQGNVETDAAIMDGATLGCGAAGAVSGVRNPVQLARAILAECRHVLLAGDGALEFAREAGVALCRPGALVTPESRRRWEKARDTVGCVARDRGGHLAAATSTGGLFDKLPGRVGDSPLIGSGTYADKNVAVSCTGEGEDIIRTVLAHRAAVIAERGESAETASNQAIEYFTRHASGEAGLIMLDRDGAMGWARRAPRMPVCAISRHGVKEVF